MLTVHHLNNSRSQRILWLLEELGVEYDIKRYERNKLTSLAPPELLAVHPLGKSPVITDGDVTVAESGAIVQYLVGKYGNGRLLPPADAPARLQYTYWLHYAEGTFMPFMVMTLIFNRLETAPMPFFIRPISNPTQSLRSVAKLGDRSPCSRRRIVSAQSVDRSMRASCVRPRARRRPRRYPPNCRL